MVVGAAASEVGVGSAVTHSGCQFSEAFWAQVCASPTGSYAVLREMPVLPFDLAAVYGPLAALVRRRARRHRDARSSARSRVPSRSASSASAGRPSSDLPTTVAPVALEIGGERLRDAFHPGKAGMQKPAGRRTRAQSDSQHRPVRAVVRALNGHRRRFLPRGLGGDLQVARFPLEAGSMGLISYDLGEARGIDDRYSQGQGE